MHLATFCFALVLLAAPLATEAQEAAKPVAPFKVPEEDIPNGPLGDAIRYGEQLLTQTQAYGKEYIGNGLNCTSCHLNGGKTPYAAPWVGIWGVFPEYRSRAAQVDALQDRINDCFQRSMNGKPLPPDSDEMRGILAYMWWLSKDVPTGVEVEGRGFKRIALSEGSKPDPANGKLVYAAKCMACHGADGEGKTGLSGAYLFPALWGPRSFNIGAGMARLKIATRPHSSRSVCRWDRATRCRTRKRSMWRPTSPGSPGQTSPPRQGTGRKATSQQMHRISWFADN